MRILIKYLDCGSYIARSDVSAGDLVVSRFSDITDEIIPFFEKYPLHGVKS